MLNNYKTNKQSASSKICIKLVNDIKNYINKDLFIQNIVKEINLSTKVPKRVLNQKIYQIVFNCFNFEKNKFEKFGLFFLVIDCLKYYFFTLINILFHRKHIKKKLFFNLICDNVFNQNDFDRYSKLIKIFKRVCLLGSYYPKNLKTKNNFRYKILNIGHSNQNLKSKFFFIKLGLLIFYYSISNRINYYRIFYLLIYDILRSNHIFSQISANYFFTNKFYGTSPIFNYYFKKAGGIKATCYQKNILAYSLSCFVFSDILFTLGKGQGNICRQLGGEIKKILPVGSLMMENNWFNKKKDLKNVPFSNVIILGINTKYSHRHYVNHIYEENYYNLFLSWINKLSLDFPNLKIIHKHHSDYENDPKEEKKMVNSNVKIMISDKSANGTYAWAHKSELILSFASTMVVEILGNGKKAYFIDPNLRGKQWFDDIKKMKKFRVGNYSDLKKLVLNRNKSSQVNKLNKNFYCLNSNYTSERIAKYLVGKKKR